MFLEFYSRSTPIRPNIPPKRAAHTSPELSTVNIELGRPGLPACVSTYRWLVRDRAWGGDLALVTSSRKE